MKALIIDSTADRLIVAGINGDREEVFVGDSGAKRHTSAILPAVDDVLSKLNMAASELNCVGVVVGPGSFTGIRIGVATANAMAMACGAHIVQITSLEPVLYGIDRGLAMLDCKHGNYYALARKDGKDEYLALTEKEALELGLPEYFINGPMPEKLLAVFKDKAERLEFCETARPFYIKKSSAEML